MEELNIDGRQWSSRGKLGFVNSHLITKPARQTPQQQVRVSGKPIQLKLA